MARSKRLKSIRAYLLTPVVAESLVLPGRLVWVLEWELRLMTGREERMAE